MEQQRFLIGDRGAFGRADDFAASLALRYASQTPEDNF
jgi:hypothetical protein